MSEAAQATSTLAWAEQATEHSRCGVWVIEDREAGEKAAQKEAPKPILRNKKNRQCRFSLRAVQVVLLLACYARTKLAE